MSTASRDAPPCDNYSKGDRCFRRTFIYYFGDHDPSGVVVDRKIEQGLREFAPDAEIHFKRVAVHPEQIREWNLPTRPTKKGNHA